MAFKKFFIRLYQKILFVVRLFIKIDEPLIIREYEELMHYIKISEYQNILLLSGKRVCQTEFYQKLSQDLGLLFNVYRYTEIPSDPSIEAIEDAKEFAVKHHIDVIIAIGGGSTMDAGKVLAARLANPKQSIAKMKGLLKIKKRILPLIVIPTTAGTGSECTVAAVVSDLANKKKYAINDPKLIPHYALLLPTVLKTLPQNLIAYCGMDTLSHLLEAYVGQANTGITNSYCIKGVHLTFNALPKLYENQALEEAAKDMQKASYLGGLVINQGYVGYAHAIAHAFAAYYHLQHGYLNAIILPLVLEAYGTKINRKVKNLLKEGFEMDVETNDACQILIDKIRCLNQLLNITNHIDMINENDYPALIKHINQEVIPLYPVPKFLTNQDLINIFNKIKNNA